MEETKTIRDWDILNYVDNCNKIYKGLERLYLWRNYEKKLCHQNLYTQKNDEIHHEAILSNIEVCKI